MEAGAALGFAQVAGFSSKIPEQHREKCRLVVQDQTFAPENISTSNVIWTQGLYLGIYMYIYICNNN